MPKNLYKNANSVIEGNYDNTLLGANTYLLGLTSLFDEVGSQGHSISDVLSGTNISPDAMNQSSLYISQAKNSAISKYSKTISRSFNWTTRRTKAAVVRFWGVWLRTIFFA